MAYTVAKCIVGPWRLDLHEIESGMDGDSELELSIDRRYFDIVVRIDSLDSLGAIVRALDEPGQDVTSPERRFAGTNTTDLFFFVKEGGLYFLLLDNKDETGRFRVSVDESEKADFVAALNRLYEMAME